MSTLDLVHAIISKDAMAIETNFNDVMADKISTKLEDMRGAVAQSMFKTPEAVVEEEYEIDEATGMKKKKKTQEAC